MFRFTFTFQILLIVVLGGMGSITGSIVAGVLVTVAMEWLRFVEQDMNFWFCYPRHFWHEDGYLFYPTSFGSVVLQARIAGDKRV